MTQFSYLKISKLITATLSLILFSMAFTGCGSPLRIEKRNGPIVGTPLTITPSEWGMKPNEVKEFKVAGGSPPYTYPNQLVPPLSVGTLTNPKADSFEFVSPETLTANTPVTLMVSDSQGVTAAATVTIYAPLSLNRSQLVLTPGGTFTFVALQGQTPALPGTVSYTLEGTANGATLNISSGLLTAGTTTSATPLTVKATELNGLKRSVTCPVIIAPALTLTPTSTVLSPNRTATFTASGGVSPYTSFVLNPSTQGELSGEGATRTLKAISNITAASTATLTVTDSANQTKSVSIEFKTPVIITPATVAILQGTPQTFSVSGGTGQYTFSLVGNYGTAQFNNQTKELTTPTVLTEPLNFQVKVTDGLSEAFSQVRVDPQFVKNPAQATLLSGQTQAFSFSGGSVAPGSSYQFSIDPANIGSLSATQGTQVTYFAPATIEATRTVTLKVRDSMREYAIPIYLKAPIQISEPTTNLKQNSTYTVRATGGSGEYNFSFVGDARTCTINATTGELKTPTTVTQEFSIVVKVQDKTLTNLSRERTYWVRTPLTLANNALSMGYSQTNTTFLNGTSNPVGGQKPYRYEPVSGSEYATITRNSTTDGATITSLTMAGAMRFKVIDDLGQEAMGTVGVARQLEITPSFVSLARQQQQFFQVSGGTPPYRFEVQGTGSGSIDPQGLYSAPNVQGAFIIKASDSSIPVPKEALATVQVGVSISPKTAWISSGKTVDFNNVGGRSPFKFAVVPSSNTVGTINATTGVFTAKTNATGSVQVTVTDLNGSGDQASATLTVPPTLNLTGNKIDFKVSDEGLLTASGGAAPFTFSLVSGPGIISPQGENQLKFIAQTPSGTFTAKVETKIKVVDASQQEKIISLWTYPAPVLSTNVQNLASNQTAQITVSRGKAPFNFTINPNAGTGSIATTNTGANYTAPATLSANGQITIEVTDNLGSKASIALNLYAPFEVKTLYSMALGTITPPIQPTGGLPPFTFTRVSGDTNNTGYIDTSRSVFVAQPWSSGEAVYDLKDSLNQTKRLHFYVLPRYLASPPNPLSHPTGIVMDSTKRFYVADFFTHRIVKYSPIGAVEISFGSEGLNPGQLRNPWGVAIAPNGNLYVSEYGNHRISVFNTSGNYLGGFGSEGSNPGQFKTPRGLTFDSEGNLFVADTGNHRVQKFSPNHTYLSTYGSYGSAEGQLYMPKSVSIISGNLLVTDNQRITRFNLSTNAAMSFGPTGDSFFSPSAIVSSVPGSGELLSLERTAHRILLLKADGTPILSLGARGTLYGQFDAPESIYQSPDGPVAVVDSNNNRIQIVSTIKRISELQRGESLQMGAQLFTPSSSINCHVKFDYDGRFKVFKDGVAAKCSTGSGTNYFQIFQTDGNSVVYNYNKGVINQAGTGNRGAVNFKFNDSCNLIISKSDGTALFTSDGNMSNCN